MRRILDFLRVEDVPTFARPNYVAELRHMALWGPVVGAMEGTIVSVVASKTFGASDLLTSVVFAIPVLINLLNMFWSVTIRGRPRVQLFIVMAGGASLGAASLALNSPAWKPWAAWAFAGQVAFTHFFLSGLVTLRTTMWKVNYPQAQRARIAGRIQTLCQLVVLTTSAVLSLCFDQNPAYYRFVYPGVAVLGLLSLWPIRRIRMRGEKAELNRTRERLAREHGGGAGAAWWAGIRESVAILRHDRLFARYMLAQFLLGSANFFTDPVLVNVLARRLNFAYFSSTLLLHSIPVTVLLISIRFWARHLDHGGVVRFRVYNSACWVGSYLGVTLATVVISLGGQSMLPLAVGILVIGRIMNGLARGGGDLAWNIGHLDFARDHQVELYMGVHVALTGVRGLVMPLLGALANRYLDWGSFAIALGMGVVSLVMFQRMAAEGPPPTRGPNTIRGRL